ncbi:glycosyltransferase [Cellulomonas sp. ICMP 17802]|uniref:glycosyltransferase n=1 Tax=Cellulomonas sp. ICMP 17802 TaxID=3239199 RepID=UPI00351ACBB2
MSTRDRTFTVVIPCYNYARFLPDAVRSALEQPDVDVEVIIVDDASSDDSLQVASGLAALDRRVTVIANGVNRGHIATYNVGLSRAQGTFLVLLSADDALAPGALSRAAAVFERHPGTALVYGYTESFVDDLPAVDPRWSPSHWSGEEWVRLVVRRGRNLLRSPEAIVRRSVHEQVGGYDPSLPHAADMAMWLELAARGDVGRVNGTTQAFYRVHGSNMHMLTFAGPVRDLGDRLEVFDRFFKGTGSTYADAPRLLAQARERVSVDALWQAALALDRNVGDASAVERLREIALEADPEATRSPLWWVSHPEDDWRAARSTVARRVYAEMWRYRSRRWRRSGT